MMRINEIRIVCPDDPYAAGIAARLKERIEKYRIPGDVKKRTGFRSVSEITEPWLIVICTPDTPHAPEVCAAIEEFIEAGRFGRILTLLVKGEPADSFPESLLYEKLPDGSIREHEPLAANIAADSEKEQLRLLETEKLRLLAPILGVSFDDLMNRRRKARRRVLLLVSAVVLAASAAFLTYAVSRMTVISEQNETLKERYYRAEAANQEAQAQRDAAMNAYVKTLAVYSENSLEEGNTEKALSQCMEYLPEYEDVPELTDAMTNALDVLCSEGYVPVTDKETYFETRGIEEPETDENEDDEIFPEMIYIEPPEEIDCGRDIQAFGLFQAFPEFGYALYSAGLKPVSDDDDGYQQSIFYTRVCFAEGPERDYFIRDENGDPFYVGYDEIVRGGYSLTVKTCHALYDGTFIGVGTDNKAFRFDPFKGEFVPFFDTGKAIEENETDGPGIDLENTYFDYFLDYEGSDVILGVTTDSVVVCSREPLCYLYTLDGVGDIISEGDADFLIGNKEGALAVFSKEHFKYLYDIRDDYTEEAEFKYSDFNTAKAPGGRSYLAYNWMVYDLNTGDAVRDFRDYSYGNSEETTPLFSGDGYILIPGLNLLRVWDPVSDSLYAELEVRVPETSVSKYPKITYEVLGPENAETGRPDSTVIAANDIVYEYRAGRDVPEDLEGKLALAEEIIY